MSRQHSDPPAWLLGHPVLVLSPHLDDALFSAAEVVRRTVTEVWTVFAGEPDPALTTAWDHACGYPDSHALMTVRLNEDRQAFSGTRATVRRLACLDGAYTTPDRRAADLATLHHEIASWIDRHAVDSPVVVLPAGAGVPVVQPLGDRVSTAIKRAAAAPGPLAPLVQPLRNLKHRAYQRRRAQALREGLAINNDHRAVRDAGLDLLSGDPRVTIVLVEDLPYLWSYTADDAVHEVAAKHRLTAVEGSLVVDRRWKHQHIRAYTSQLPVMDADGRLSQVATLPQIERHWVLTQEG